MNKAGKAHEVKMARLLADARAVVAGGVCPSCGTRLVRNSAMAGWWQCGAYACEAMRATEFQGLPTCHFQTFTER